MRDVKDLMRRFVDEFQSQHRIETADEFIAEDFVDHSAPTGLPGGREGVKTLFRMYVQSFPDFRAEIHDIVAEDDKVVTRKTFYGTHEGEFMGIAPTGKRVAIDVIDIVRVREGQFVEHWNVVDRLGMLQQLGAIPE